MFDRSAPDIATRLGVDVPRGWWSTAPLLKGLEAAGFAWVQVHTPPREILCDRERSGRHAAALRTALNTSGLRLILHGPDDLSAGDPDHDRALDGLLDYAAATRARYVVYHGANFPVVDGGAAAARIHQRAVAEESALRERVARIERLGFTLAVENLAPVWPGPPRLCHSPRYIRELVMRVGSPNVGMLLDLGHANIAAGLAGGELRAILESVSDAVCLFHVHDNLGARRAPSPGPGLDPLRLDLHLAPGSGRLPWERIAPALVSHPAPLMLEVHPPHRPEPTSLATVTSELLLRRPLPIDGSRTALADVTAERRSVPLG